MKLIKPIVDYINSTLQTGKLNGVYWQSGKWFGVCSTTAGVDVDGNVEYYVHENGNDVTPDDTYPVTVYHRCTGVQFVPIQSQFGTGSSLLKARYNMRAVVFVDTEKIKMEANDLAFLFYAGFPDEIKRSLFTIDGIAKCTVTATSAETDTAKVFQGEFAAPYAGQLASSVLIAVNYVIEIDADRHCLACQDCT